MTSETTWQRSELLGTQVITRDRGKRLGVVSQLWVDVDQREIVAIGLRENFLAVAGIPKYMYLNTVREIGDVILVDDDRVLEDDIDVEAYSTLINCEVITETGEPLGRVRGYRFNAENGKLVSLIIASIGIPQIPDQVISTYELSIDEIVSSGPERLIVFEGSEERLQQLSVGVLERLGLGEAPWNKEEEGLYYPPTVKPANQLGTGVPQRTPQQEYRPAAPAVEETWEAEAAWVEPEPLPQVQSQAAYDNYEADNWGDDDDNYEEAYPAADYVPVEASQYEDEADVEADIWADDETPKPYKAPRVNIPEKKKMPEYETEDGGY
jgi:sporulation protein YlmC with PRC-barrel domain